MALNGCFRHMVHHQHHQCFYHPNPSMSTFRNNSILAKASKRHLSLTAKAAISQEPMKRRKLNHFQCNDVLILQLLWGDCFIPLSEFDELNEPVWLSLNGKRKRSYPKTLCIIRKRRHKVGIVACIHNVFLRSDAASNGTNLIYIKHQLHFTRDAILLFNNAIKLNKRPRP